MKELKNIETKDLVNELIEREGVEKYMLDPYEESKIIIDDKAISHIGPHIILIITD